MKVSCQHCGSSYSVADDKVTGRKVRLRCKKCGESIVLDNTGADLELESVAPSMSGDGAPAWHISIGDAAQGPYTLEELSGYVANGSVAADALVYRDGWPDWKPLPEVDALRIARPRTSRPPALPPQARGRASVRPEPTMGSDPFDDAAQAPSPRLSGADLLSGVPREGTVQFSVDQIRALSAVSVPAVMPVTPSARTPGYASGNGSGLIDVASLVESESAEGWKPITSADLSPIDTMTPMALPTLQPEVGGLDFRTKVIAGVVGLGMVLTALVVTVALVTRRPVVTAAAPQPPIAAPVQVAAPPPPPAAAVANVAQAAVPAAAPVAEPEKREPAEPEQVAAAEPPRTRGKTRGTSHRESRAASPSPIASDDTTSRHASSKHAAASKHESEPLAAVTSPKSGASKTSAADIDALIAKDPERPAKKGGNASIDDLLDGAVSAKKAPPKSEPEAKSASSLPQTPSREDMSAAYSKAKAKAQGCKGSGVAAAMITVSGSGRVSSVSVSGVDDAAKSCVEKAVRSTPFPKFQKDSFEVKFPFKLGG